MASSQDLQIITVYAAGQTKGARSRIRVLAVLSLVVATVWLVQAGYPRRVLGYNTADRWLKSKLIAAGLSQSTDMMGDAEPDLRALLRVLQANPPSSDTMTDSAEQQAATQAFAQRMRVLLGSFYGWKAIAILAGSWLALAGLAGLTGRRVALTLHRQAAVLMIVSTIATVVGMYVAVRWGGMPPISDPLVYIKVAGVQSVYAWILLIVAPFVR